MCWNERFEVLQKPEEKKQCLIKDIKSIKEEPGIGALINFNKHAKAHPISEEIDEMHNVVLWVKSLRMFKNNVKKVGNKKSLNYY